ncbi:MAG: hypothetical protein HY774_03840 [Acidobacteria bacterium]|nr:hypothetical protein [Acidobacteriota bacterium]
MSRKINGSSMVRITSGSSVVLSLHSPREKIWGILVSIEQSGVQICGVDINTFDDWLNSVTNGESNIGLTNSFLPMWRVERISLDETVGDILSLEEQFALRVGITLTEYLKGARDGYVSSTENWRQ